MSKQSMADHSLSKNAQSILSTLGENIKTARLRRNISQEEISKRTQMSIHRLRKVENGDPTVGLGAVVQILDILDLVDTLALVANPLKDKLGLMLETKRLPKRVKSRTWDREKDLDF